MTYIAPEECAFGISFLERLEANSKPLSMAEAPSLDDILISIRRNISDVLNTRMGAALSCPSLGLIDFNDATLKATDLSTTIRVAIKQCLNAYEPRLKNIEVLTSFDSFEAFALRFQIVAELNNDAIHRKVKLNLIIDQNKKYRVFQ
ncbi:type VI secretion system baseplate subunit TssE [Vibrio algivorus]|uniref:Type VI secretion system baseplate subunit TssE n=1 Tax=Vibrio algivorus TaxID=1667024 RepID=A0A557P5F2_9VIBR|nr:type VI secretion system baseplate subunit TssE [Vibrio algivorus]TVO35868.1 type VI secretion system baseplate subunit TssE [Vibrio algivorus]